MGGSITKNKFKKNLIDSEESIPIASVNIHHQIASLKVFPEYLGDQSFNWATVLGFKVNAQEILDKYSNSKEWNLFFITDKNERICKINENYYFWKNKN